MKGELEGKWIELNWTPDKTFFNIGRIEKNKPHKDIQFKGSEVSRSHAV